MITKLKIKFYNTKEVWVIGVAIFTAVVAYLVNKIIEIVLNILILAAYFI